MTPMAETATSEFFHIIKTQQFDRALLDELCEITTAIRRFAKEKEGHDYLRGLLSEKRAMLYFTQPSTRTFLSFSTAAQILGMQTCEIRDPSTSSEMKCTELSAQQVLTPIWLLRSEITISVVPLASHGVDGVSIQLGSLSRTPAAEELG